MTKLIHVKAHTRKKPKKLVNKHGIKQNLTKQQLADRKKLATKLTKAQADMTKYRGKDHKKYKIAFDKYWDASEELQNKYGVH